MKVRTLQKTFLPLAAAIAIMGCQIDDQRNLTMEPEEQSVEIQEQGSKAAVSPVYVYSGPNRTGQAQLFRTTINCGNLNNYRWPNGVTLNDTINCVYVPPTAMVIMTVDTCFRGKQHILHGGNLYNLSALGLGNRMSSMEIVQSPQAFDGYTYLKNYPHDRENSWAKECQGVTNDGTNWYISTKWNIRKIPKNLALNGSFNDRIIINRPFPNLSSNHIGDISYYNGELYVPVEGCPGGTYGGACRIFVYDTNGKMKRWAYLKNQSHASWVTVNPDTGKMYSSDFDSNVINVYPPNFTNGQGLSPFFQLRIVNGKGEPVKINGIQGGVFAPRNMLYLSVSKDGGGIRMFRCLGGEARFAKVIGPNGYKPGSPNYEEVEGLTWWNLDGDPNIHSSIQGGQLHWLLLDNDPGNEDDIYFKHMRIKWK